MIGFEVASSKFPGAIKSVIYHEPGRVRDKLFDLTMDPEIAIDCENWCEIASVGECYTGRNFSVTVIDE